mgnify:FL=1
MKLPKELLYKLSEGRCTPDEKKAIDEWMNDGEWDLNEEKILPGIKDNIWQKLNNNITFPSQVAPIIRRYLFLKVASVFILIFAGIALFYFIKKDTSSTQQVYVTNANEQKRILLADSSVVFLSPNSILKVTQPFPDHKRDIELSGEAFFEVAKDASKPFTNNIRTTALGTSFKVTSFPDKNHISIALSYGKVLVQNHRSNAVTDSFYLAPGEAIEYDKVNKKIEKTKIIEQQLSYKNSILYFKEAGIKEVVNKLQEFYHIKVEYGSLKNADWRVSGEFEYQPLEIVMENLSFSCNISYKIIGNTLILKK